MHLKLGLNRKWKIKKIFTSPTKKQPLTEYIIDTHYTSCNQLYLCLNDLRIHKKYFTRYTAIIYSS